MMGRLTKRAGGTVVYAGGYKQYEGGDIPAEVSPQGVRELLVRLAEYEDTGMAPEDVLTAHEMAQIYSLVECENEAVSTDHEGGASYSLNFYLDDFCSYGQRKEETND